MSEPPEDSLPGSVRASSFGERAALYDRLRPSYPASILPPLLGDARVVADVGAGTGKLTALLAAAGLDVTAVEPDPGMRAELSRRLPSVPVLAGSGEALPLADASVDAVTYAQAWHWVRPADGLREAARVLRPGGVLALVWNTDGAGVDWLDRLNELYGGGRAAVEKLPVASAELAAAAGFGPVEQVDVAWEQALRPGDLPELAMTWSVIATLPATERDTVLAAIADLAATHPDLAGRETVTSPHVCRGFALRRLPL